MAVNIIDLGHMPSIFFVGFVATMLPWRFGVHHECHIWG